MTPYQNVFYKSVKPLKNRCYSKFTEKYSKRLTTWQARDLGGYKNVLK